MDKPMTKEEIQAEIKSIESRLITIGKQNSQYDPLMFTVNRNNTIGTMMVTFHRPELKWNGGHSIEQKSQHWLYYVLVLIGNMYPDRIFKLYEQLGLKSINDIKNTVEGKYVFVTISQKDLYDFLMDTMGLLANTQSRRIKIGDEVQIVKRTALTKRRAEVTDLTEKLKLYKLKLKTI